MPVSSVPASHHVALPKQRQLLGAYDLTALDRFQKAACLTCDTLTKAPFVTVQAFDQLKSKEKAYKKLLDTKQLHDGRYQAQSCSNLVKDFPDGQRLDAVAGLSSVCEAILFTRDSGSQ